MRLSKFIQEHRKELDEYIAKQVHDEEGKRYNDQERRMWVLNDEGLYLWARAEGCRI